MLYFEGCSLYLKQNVYHPVVKGSASLTSDCLSEYHVLEIVFLFIYFIM